ncbi:MAG: poly-gamma-glutamate system protein, partial [Candidatus Cloacimonetes bacterium]|nr:poly-gamma-glutamate system protein [Candidatus Cloacimonadota bacterium]
FGATDPDFTWLDMETLLNEKGIFTYKSVAASLGGGRDLGRGLNLAGRELILAAIARNNVKLVKGETLEDNIAEKMKLFKKAGKIKLYVNIGGGLSSLGNSINGRLVQPGYHRYLNIKNIPLKGTMFLFADEGIPVIHLLDIEKMAEIYELPLAPDPMPEPGTGKTFLDERYNLTVTSVALAVLVLLIILIIVFDQRKMILKPDETKSEY